MNSYRLFSYRLAWEQGSRHVVEAEEGRQRRLTSASHLCTCPLGGNVRWARVEAPLLDPRPVRGEQRDHALAARLLAGLVEDLHGAALVDDDLGGELEAEVERV